MRARATQGETRDRCGVAPVAGHGAQEGEPVGGHRAVEDVAAGQAEDALQVRRCEHLVVEDALREARRDLVDEREDPLGQARAQRFPARCIELGRDVLHEERGQVSPLGRDALVDDRGKSELDHRAQRQLASPGRIVGGLEGVQIDRAEMDRAAMLGPRARPLGVTAEHRETIQRGVDLDDRAAHVDRLDGTREIRRKRVPPDEGEEGVPRVGPGEHLGGLHDAAVLELHAPGPALLHENAGHGCLALDRGAGLLGRRAQGLGEGAHAALHVGPDAARTAGLSHHVVEEHVARPRRGGPRPRTDQGVGGQGAAQGLTLEPGLEHRTSRPEQEGEGLRDLLAEPPGRPAGAHQGSQVGAPKTRRVGRRCVQQGLDHLGRAVEHRFVGRQALGVLRGEDRDRGGRRAGIAAHQQAAAVGQRREGGGIAGQEAQPVPIERQLAHDRRPHQARDVGRAGHPVAGPELLGDTGAAEQRSPLEQQRAAAGASQVGRGRQAVVAPAHDDGVEAITHAVARRTGRHSPTPMSEV